VRPPFFHRLDADCDFTTVEFVVALATSTFSQCLDGNLGSKACRRPRCWRPRELINRESLRIISVAQEGINERSDRPSEVELKGGVVAPTDNPSITQFKAKEAPRTFSIEDESPTRYYLTPGLVFPAFSHPSASVTLFEGEVDNLTVLIDVLIIEGVKILRGTDEATEVYVPAIALPWMTVEHAAYLPWALGAFG